MKMYGLALVFLTFCQSSLASDIFSEPTLRAGFYTKSFPDFSYEDLEISVKLLAEEIGKNVGISTQVIVYKDIVSMRLAFEQGKINFVVASALSLATEFDSTTLTDGFRLIRENESTDSMLILTRKDEGMDNFSKIRGKRLALAEYDPMAELYMDYLSLLNFRQGYADSFILINREKKAHQLILKLFFHQADIVCVYQNAFSVAMDLNPQIAQKIQTVLSLEHIPQGAGLFHKNVPEAFREQVIAEAIKLKSNVRGQQLLELFKADLIIRARIDDLYAAKRLYQDHQQLVNDK